MRFSINGRQYDTDKMTDLNISTCEVRGVRIVGVFITKRTQRVFVYTYSIWEDGRNLGIVVGPQLHEADAHEIAQLADDHNSPALYALVPDDSD